MSEWVWCPKCGTLMNEITSGHICPLCGYRLPAQTITTVTGTTVEYVPVIRCKDCKWYKTNYSWDGKEHRVCVIEPYEPVRKADDFCSRAERKEE